MARALGTHSTKVWSPPKAHPRQGFHCSQAGHSWAAASSPWSFPMHPRRRFCPCHLCYPSGIWWLDKAERRGKVRWWSEKMIAAGTSRPEALSHLTHLPLIPSTGSAQRAGDSPFPKLRSWVQRGVRHFWPTAKLSGMSKNFQKSRTRSLSALSDNSILALDNSAVTSCCRNH